MNNSLWVTLHILWKAVLWLVTSFPMTNRQWVTLHILWKAVSSDLFLWSIDCQWHCTFCDRQSHQIFSYNQQQVSEITLCERQSDQIFSYDQQQVSDTAHCVKSSLSRSFPIWTNSKWVTLQILWKTVSWHLSYDQWQGVSGIAPLWKSHHILSYDQQIVSVIAHCVNGSLIAFFPMTNSLWVTLQILWKAVSSHLFLSSTGSEWHCTFCERHSQHVFSYH